MSTSSFDDEIERCPICNSVIEFYLEPLYRGMRGRCVTCGSNWPES